MKHCMRRILAVMLLIAIALPLCACSGNNNTQRRSDKTNTLYVGYVGTSFPSSYMPWQSRDGIAPTISSILYSTLFSYDDLTGTYESLLADNWCYTDKKGNPLTKEDGSIDYNLVAETYKEEQTLSSTHKKKYMVVRVELNKNAKWSDGTPVTVDDVYFSLDLCANNQLSNHAGALAWVSDLKHVNPVEGQKNEIRDLLGKKDFRKAIALSINQEELINRCLDGAGSTYSAGLVSNTLESMYNPESDILRGDYEARLAEANAILDTYTTEKDSLGYRIYNGKRISYEVLGNPGEQDTISYLQIQLQKIGIELKYAPSGNSPENTYLYHSRFDMTLQGITFSLSTVDIMLNAHFVNLNKSSNYGRIVDEELAAKINKMRNTLNLDEKNALLKDIQVDIANLYYKIPLYSANVTSVARTDRFTGYVVSPSQTAFSLETLQNLEFVGG